MHSTLRQRRKLRELEVQFDVKDTATLVAACNKSKDNQEQHDAFLDWIENYVRCFEELSISDSHQLAMEFVQLADVVAEDARTKELVRNAFCCLCSKIRDNNYGEEKLILALCYFLLSVDCQAFEGNPHHLTRLARDVMSKLGPEATFSRGTYPTHSVSLSALHHLCAVIHEVDPAELDHGKRGGLFQLLDQCLGNIISTQSYYPFCYQAMLTRQSLASMDSHSGTSSKEIWYRMFHALRGIAYFYHALAEVATLKIDVGSFDKSVEELTEAFARHNIESKDWFEIVHELIHFRMLVQKDPEELENFKECLEKIDEILDNTANKEDQLALRYTMIRQVTLLALDCPSKKTKEWAVGEFFNFGTSLAQRKGWARDVRTLEALLDAMSEIHQVDEFADEMVKVIDHMKLYFRTEEQSKTIINWMHITRWKRDVQEMPKCQDQKDGDILFQKVKAELSLHRTISTPTELQLMLEKKYKRESKVLSLFDNEPPKHVRRLHHSLVLHEKEVANDGKVEVHKTPIDMQDLFKDRKLSFGKSAKKVTRLMLFGNPGTGKTTIAKKIAYLWSIGKWGETFDLVYLVPVRELVSVKYDDLSMRTRKNLQTAITNICFPGKKDDEYESIKQHVEGDLDKDSTLVVFDGFDEGEEATRHMIETIELKSCRVLVLSRPRNLHSVESSPYVEVECMGMNDKQLNKFIKSKTSSTELEKHLQRHPTIWEISHVPVVANILTFLYNTKKESIVSEESSLDMFSLYRTMTLNIWNRFVDKSKSDADRNQIFEALEEIAFRALENGQILIEQDLVHEIGHNRHMRDVLKDCGFLLLKKEGFFYQFPHLTFQELFAGQYMAHSVMGNDNERRQRAIEFLQEHKYCANFSQMLCFMMQSCVAKKGAKGYHEMESLIDATPIAIGYQYHLKLTLELLDAALSASKKQDRVRILNSTKVLEIALEWIWRTIWGYRNFSYNPIVPFRNAAILASVIDFTGMLDEYTIGLFAKTAKVARYDSNQWERIMKMLQSRPADGCVVIVHSCRRSVEKAIPEEAENIKMLPWEDSESENECARKETMESNSHVGELVPTKLDEIQETSESSSMEKSEDTRSISFEQADTLWERPHRIVKRMRGLEAAYDSDDDFDLLYSSISDLADCVRDKDGEVMELIRIWSHDDEDTKLELVERCRDRLEFGPAYSKEFVEIIWTLCEDDVHTVCSKARESILHAWLYHRKIGDIAANTLLMLAKSEPDSPRSALVRLVAIAYNLTEGTQEDFYCLFSNLNAEYIYALYNGVRWHILYDEGKRASKAVGLHVLHLMCLKALNPEFCEEDDILTPLGVEENELLKTIEEADAFPIKVAVMSTRLLAIELGRNRVHAPCTIRNFAVNFPEYREEILDTLEVLMEDYDDKVADKACIEMISVLGDSPHRAKRTMNKFEKLIKNREAIWFVNHIHRRFSLDSLLRAYIECHRELLIPFIVRKLFETPVTMEPMRNGSAQLIVHTASDSKKTYSFKTTGDSEVFISILEKCTERRFQEVAPLIWSRVDKRKNEAISDTPSSSKRQCV